MSLLVITGDSAHFDGGSAAPSTTGMKPPTAAAAPFSSFLVDRWRTSSSTSYRPATRGSGVFEGGALKLRPSQPTRTSRGLGTERGTCRLGCLSSERQLDHVGGRLQSLQLPLGLLQVATRQGPASIQEPAADGRAHERRRRRRGLPAPEQRALVGRLQRVEAVVRRRDGLAGRVFLRLAHLGFRVAYIELACARKVKLTGLAQNLGQL